MASLKLIWARHGEAAGQSSGGDKVRPLTRHGHVQAQSLAEQLQNLGWIPQTIFCSAAQRTKETMETLRQTWKQEIPYSLEDSFYLGNLYNVQHIFEQHDLSDFNTILVLGHNPGWSTAPQELSGDPVSLSTANAALLSIQADDWNTALQTSFHWTLDHIIR